MARPQVSIIIPTLNEADNLRLLLPSLRSQDASFEFEILVIDSGSTDATLDVCRDNEVRTLEIPKGTFDHGGTRQEAARHAEGDILVFTVGDALPADKHWLAQLVGPVLEDDQVAGSYGIQVGPEAPLVNPLEQDVSLENQIASEVAEGPHAWRDRDTDRVYKKVRDGFQFAELKPGEQRRLASFDNCNSCARKRVLLDEAPFQTTTFGEDYQWAARVLALGYAVAFVPRAKVFHYHVQDFRYFFRRMWLDQKVVRQVFGLHGHRTVFEAANSWRKELVLSWRLLGRLPQLGFGEKLRWFGYNFRMITANRLARYLTEAEGRAHPMGWIADRVERRLGQVVTIRRPD